MSTLINTIFILLQLAGVGLQLFTLPGYVLQFATFFAWFIFFDEYNLISIILLLLLTIFVSLIDNIANLLGAKRFGASKWGVIGAFVGGLLSLLTGQFWGIFILPFLFSAGFEMLFEKKYWKDALKSGFGTFIGFITGYFLKLAISISIAVWGIVHIL